MPQTIQCTNCGVVLNLPEGAVGKRLKCPKCGTKFPAVPADVKAQSGLSSMPRATAGPDSSQDIPRKAADDLLLPTAPSDLRESFDLPLMSEEAPNSRPAAQSSGRSAADALALFDQPKPAAKRPTGAEARAKPRRCPTCGGVVPVGMSLCQTCGLDLDTGTRIDLVDDLTPAPPPPPSGMPLNILVLGGICALGSGLLAIYSAIQAASGAAGWIYFLPVCLFGVYAAVQFLRGKSLKLLMAALTLGVVLNVVSLIVMPIAKANEDIENTRIQKAKERSDNPDAPDYEIKNISEVLDFDRIYTGISLLLLYALVSIYMISPSVSKQFRK